MDHPAKDIGAELAALDTKIAQMGGLAEYALGQAIDALSTRDPALAQETLDNDRAIDRLERAIEETAIGIIARHQPAPEHLRHIITGLRISGDLERIGDLAKNISKRAIAVADAQHPKLVIGGFLHIGETAMRQLKDVLDAFSQRDAEKARRVWEQDGEIDAMYNSLYRDLLVTMTQEPRNVGVYAHLLFGAKNLERIGDHATNIAETTYHLISGTALADERPTLDTTSVTVFDLPEPAEAR
jgi:phosphate transport system protein